MRQLYGAHKYTPSHKCIIISKQTTACTKCTSMKRCAQHTPRKTHPTTTEVNNDVPWPSQLQDRCHQVFQLLTLALHTLSWYLSWWHRDTALSRLFYLSAASSSLLVWYSCWHSNQGSAFTVVFSCSHAQLGWYLFCHGGVSLTTKFGRPQPSHYINKGQGMGVVQFLTLQPLVRQHCYGRASTQISVLSSFSCFI